MSAAPLEEPVSPAHARLGSEALVRLRARYSDVMANISRRVLDDERREQLKETAERLNPDNWVTDDEVKAGLEEYETVLASLRDVVGRRRRRRRSRRPEGGGGGEGPGSPADGPEQDVEGSSEPDDQDGGDDGPGSDPLPGS